MKKTLIYTLWSLSLLWFGTVSAVQAQQPDGAAIRAFAEEQLAYSIGLQAYLYGYPTLDYLRIMHEQTTPGLDKAGVYAPANQFYFQTELAEPGSFYAGRAPNRDTIYFTAWLDLRSGPVIIHTPDTHDRYYALTIADFFTEVQHTGRRTTGTKAQTVVVSGPGWRGNLPKAAHHISLKTDLGYILGRAVVNGKEDLPTAKSLVEAFTIEGPDLSQLVPLQFPSTDDLVSPQFFCYLNRFLRRNPPVTGEAALLAQFDRIMIGPNSQFVLKQLSKATQRGLTRAVEYGHRILKEYRFAHNFVGWTPIRGVYGEYGYDYFQRAVIEYNGMIANLPEEAVYPSIRHDATGKPLSGANRYRLLFTKDNIPPVDAFWSITAYDLRTMDLIANSIDRYSIGDRTKGLKIKADGSIDIRIQSTPPEEQDVNWLPVNDGPFLLSLRMYQPQSRAFEKDYLLPEIEKLAAP